MHISPEAIFPLLYTKKIKGCLSLRNNLKYSLISKGDEKVLVNNTSVKIMTFYFLLLEFLKLRTQLNHQGEHAFAIHAAEE